MKQQFLVSHFVEKVNNANMTEIRTMNKKSYAQIWNNSPFASDEASSIIRFEIGDEKNHYERGLTLLKEIVRLYKGKHLVEQVSNDVSVEMHYQAGFRVDGINTLKETLDLLKRKGSIMMEVHIDAKVPS